MFSLSSVVRNAIFAAASLAAVAHAADSSSDGETFTWEAWFTCALIVVLLVAMVLDAVPATSAMVMSSMILYLVGIVDVTELFAGMVNNGVLSIVFLFIIVTPMTQLPLMKRMVEVTLAASTRKTADNDDKKDDDDADAEAREPAALVAATPEEEDEDVEKEPETVFWPTTKLVLLSILTSSFVENTPHVAAFTPMVTKFCMEHNVAPSLLLLPMNFAVILGNYGVVGCSSNLVFSGLLEEDGYGQMDFFELIKVGGPQLPIICLYLIIFPWFLLPRNKGGMVGGGDKKKSNHLALRLLMSAESTRLVGLTVEKAKRQLAGGQGMKVSKVLRGADEAELDLENDTLAVGDVLFVAGPPALLLAACEHFALDFVTANGNLATAQALQWHNDKKKGHHQEQQTSEQHRAIKDADGGDTAAKDEGDATVAVVEMKTVGAEEEKSAADDAVVVAPAKAVKLTLAEVVLSARNQALGRTVSTQVFQSAYGASILAVRASATGEEVVGEAALRGHVLTAGDTLLLLTATTFERDNHSTYEFLMISMIGNVDAEAEPFVLTFPGWAPFGIASGDAGEGKPQKKLVVMPPEYGYLSLLIFLAVVVAAVFHVKLSVLCLGGAILIVLSGISTTAKALKMIHLDVYVLIAFSFPLGSAVKNSGLANWIGKQILYAGIRGFPLMLLIVVMAVVLTNVITNKAACQVMYPVIIAIYTTRGEDPVPAVMAAAYAVVLALCTPYAIPPNVLVFGPGGYTGLDYLKFGLPLTVLCTFMTAIFAMVTYDLEW